MSYRAAIIGCGKIGSEFALDPRIKDIYTHAGAYRACPDTTLAAVCDTDEEKARRCAGMWNVPQAYTDFEEMLKKERPEILSVCTPDPTHYSILRRALESEGLKAVLVEKPVAMSIEEAEAILPLATRNKILIAVNYSRRYSQLHQHIRTLVGGGTLGKIQAVSGYYTKGVRHSGTHWFDLARFLLGEVRSVSGADTLHEVGPDPTLDAKLEFASGAAGYLHACDSTAFGIFEMDIIGTVGRIRIFESGHKAELYLAEDSPYYTGYRHLGLKQSWENGMHDTLLHAVEDVVRCLETGLDPLCSARDGIEALRIAVAVSESAESGKTVQVRPGGRMKKRDVVVIAGDPGGAGALDPVIGILKGDPRLAVHLLAYRQALTRWDEPGWKPMGLPETTDSKTAGDLLTRLHADILVTATSNNPACLEKKFIAAAVRQEIPVLSVIDFWSNYVQRFCDNAGTLSCLPDRIAVMDPTAREAMIACGFPQERLFVTGQPAFDALRGIVGRLPQEELEKIRSDLGVPDGSLFVLFVSQPLSLLYGEDTGTPGHLGYTEKTVVQALVQALDRISAERRRQITLVIRPHPREKPADYRAIPAGNIRVLVSSRDNARDLVRAADLVTGMCTELLVEACYLGCPVASIQPGLKIPDPLPTNKGGLSRAVYSIEAIKPVLEELLFDERCRQEIRDTLKGFRPDGKSGSRTAALIYALLGMEENGDS